ncbi:glutaredoxin family protein [Pseudonocardia ailaonensis]|uniref:Glutaredoxin family protein n=1 Tax=Pseudonocardia ailaonensis TaxID=367279 RepID=A0ABN2NGR9_9PSEU
MRVTVLTRVNCHLCDEAEAAVAGICGELGVAWSTEDVDADPELRAEYGDMVPVIMIDGKQHGYYKVEADRLRRALTE